MLKNQFAKTLIVFCLVLSILACNLSRAVATPTLGPTSTLLPSLEAPSPTVESTDTATVAAVTPAYVSYPSDPTTIISGIKDEVFPSNYGDNFQANLFERPFQLDNIYRPDADIVSSTLSDEGEWYYFSTEIAGFNPATKTMDSPFGFEIDYNRDGRGDFLLWATPPFSAKWTNTGVQVYTDTNRDVGNRTPIQSDAPVSVKTDGYETTLVMNGTGADPEAAWARQSPSNPNLLQIAVKKSLINQSSFLWWAWTDFDLGNPALFDYNDAYTAKEAGSPYAASPNYPLKALFGMDNTCRAAYGFTPTGREPGLCGTLPAPTQAVVVTPRPSSPTPTRTLPPPPPPVLPGEITGIVFFDNNANGVFDAGDVGKDTYQITVFQNGGCSGSAYLGARPAPDGNYTLTNLPAGLWCLRLEYSGSPVLPSNPQTVTVAPGGDTTVNFAIQGPG